MPPLSGAGLAVIVNAGNTGLTTTVGALALAGNLTTTGSFNTSLTQQANVTLTLPATSDTIVGRATTDTLTNKTLTAPVLGGTVTGTYTLGGTLSIGSLTGILKCASGLVSAATSGTDYAPATSGAAILYGNGLGGFSNVTVGTGLSFSGGTLTNTISAAAVTSVAGRTGAVTLSNTDISGLGTASTANAANPAHTVVTIGGSITDSHLIRSTGTGGDMLDSGIAVSNVALVSNLGSAAAKTATDASAASVMSVIGAVTGDIVKFDSNGSGVDSGIAASDVARFSQAAAFASTVATGALTVTGAMTATGNITAFFSDDRLKTRLGVIENALGKVMSLTGFYYEPNATALSLGYELKRDVALSAQDVLAIMPEVVAPAPIDKKYLTLRYDRLIPLVIEAIKELKLEVDLLKAAK